MIKLVSTIGYIIVNDENKILLLKQSKEVEKEDLKSENLILPKVEEKKDETKEEYSIVFGTVEEDENPRDVIRREVENELGCNAKDCNYFNLYFNNISDNFIKKTCYFYGTIEGNIKTKDSSISAEWINLDKEEIFKLDLAKEQKEALIDFANFFKDKFLEKTE